MQCVLHFCYIDKNFSSIQILVNKKYFHQFSFKFIKTFFISPASIYATLSGGNPRLAFHISTFLHSLFFHWIPFVYFSRWRYIHPETNPTSQPSLRGVGSGTGPNWTLGRRYG